MPVTGGHARQLAGTAEAAAGWDARALAGWLLAAPLGGRVEDRGAAAILAAVSGADVTAVMWSRRARTLTARQQYLLQSLGAATGHERRGFLLAGQVPAAATTAILLPRRVPARVREVLGIACSGAALPAAGDVPLGRALAGLGVRREPLEVRLTPGRRDPGGREQVICSAARLWLGGPVAIVVERIYQEFLTRYPGPWQPW
jgi:hypothetical protein